MNKYKTSKQIQLNALKKLGYLEQFLFNFQFHADGSAKQILFFKMIDNKEDIQLKS